MATATALCVSVSGHVAVGKTTLASRLVDELQHALYFSSSRVLRELCGEREPSRADLQALGERLDSESDGMWLREAALSEVAHGSLGRAVIVVDAVRTQRQVLHLAEIAQESLHIHLKAHPAVLEARYDTRRATSPDREFRRYGELLLNRTEASVSSLGSTADLVIDTGRWAPDGVSALAAAATRLATSTLNRSHGLT